MSRFSTQAREKLKEVGAACPYTALGRKVVRAVKTGAPAPQEPSDAESRLRGRIRIGGNIALIGFFCPIFWCSLLAGAAARTVCLNAVHSGVVIFIGAALMVQARVALNREPGAKAAGRGRKGED